MLQPSRYEELGEKNIAYPDLPDFLHGDHLAGVLRVAHEVLVVLRGLPLKAHRRHHLALQTKPEIEFVLILTRCLCKYCICMCVYLMHHFQFRGG